MEEMNASQVRSVKLVDNEKIVLNAEGRFPLRIILYDPGKQSKEYRLCKTREGKLILNK